MSNPNVTTYGQAHKPSVSEVRARKNIFVQLVRFAALNVKMIAMVTKGHH